MQHSSAADAEKALAPTCCAKLLMMVSFLGTLSSTSAWLALMTRSVTTVRASTKSEVPPEPRGSGAKHLRVSTPGPLSSCGRADGRSHRINSCARVA